MNTLRIVLLVLAVGVLGLVGWRSTVDRVAPPAAAGPPLVAAPPQTLATLAQAMRAPSASLALAPLPLPPPAAAPAPDATPVSLPAAREPSSEVPEFASFYGRLKQDFPHDYDGLPGRARSDADAETAIWDALRGLQQSQGILAAQADDAALDRLFDARSAMLDGLAPLNARQCVDFLYGATDASIADFTASHHGLVATLADRTLDAIADGRLHHVERPTPTAADLDALSAGLISHGLSPAEVGLLIDGTTPDPPIPDARTCEIGRIYLGVLHGLPADPRERIYGLAAVLLARS